MKLRIVRKDGSQETLTLVPPVEINLGEHLNVLTDATGMDHYFYPDDGRYDGWGRAVSIPLPDGFGNESRLSDNVADAIDRVEMSREIEPRKDSDAAPEGPAKAEGTK